MKKTILILTTVAAGCNSGTSPSLLDHATLLAVRSEPPRIEAGERAKIVALATTEEGTPIELDRPAIAAAGLPEEIAAQMLQQDDDGSFVIAPPEPALEQMRKQLSLPEDAPIPLMLELDTPVSPIVQGASKVILLGGRANNPRILEVTLDGAAIAGETTIALGTTPKLAVVAEGEGNSELSVAWASTLGELEHYRSAEATFLAAIAGRGHIVVVVRDPSGGVEWRIIDTEVVPR